MAVEQVLDLQFAKRDVHSTPGDRNGLQTRFTSKSPGESAEASQEVSEDEERKKARAHTHSLQFYRTGQHWKGMKTFARHWKKRFYRCLLTRQWIWTMTPPHESILFSTHSLELKTPEIEGKFTIDRTHMHFKRKLPQFHIMIQYLGWGVPPLWTKQCYDMLVLNQKHMEYHLWRFMRLLIFSNILLYNIRHSSWFGHTTLLLMAVHIYAPCDSIKIVTTPSLRWETGVYGLRLKIISSYLH